jgi:hypothetical protein
LQGQAIEQGKEQETHPAIPVHPVQIDKEVSISVLVVRTEELLDGIGRFPSIVVRDLGGDVVAGGEERCPTRRLSCR